MSLFQDSQLTLKMSLFQDSQVTLQMMLTSQYLADHRQEAEYWTHSLTELK